MFFIPKNARGCGCLLLLVALYGFGTAFQGLWTAYQNPEPTELTCAEYADSQPDASWLKLKKCRVNLLEAVYERGPIDEVEDNPIETAYLPLRPDRETGGKKPPKTGIVVKTQDDEITEFLTKAAKQSGDDSEEQSEEIDPEMKSFLRDHQEKLLQVRSFEGTVEYGLDADSETHEQVAELSNYLEEDFAVLSEGKKPSYSSSFGSLGMGFALLIVSLGLMVWGGEDETEPQQGAASGAPPEPRAKEVEDVDPRTG